MPRLSFRTAFVLALLVTLIEGTKVLGILDAYPKIWSQLATLVLLGLTWVNATLANPLQSARFGERQPLPLPDPRPGAAGGPMLALVCLGALFAGGCDTRIDAAGVAFVGFLGVAATAMGLAALLVRRGEQRWMCVSGFCAVASITCFVVAGVSGCTVAERARIRDGLITTSIGAVNCTAPGLQAGIQAAVVQLLGSAVSGRGAGTAAEWRALGLGLRDKYGLPAAACAAEVATKELAKLALAPGPAVASAAPVVGFVQPQSGGTKAQASGGALGMEASAGGGSVGVGQAGSVTSAEDVPAARALAAAQWLRNHPGEW